MRFLQYFYFLVSVYVLVGHLYCFFAISCATYYVSQLL